MDVELLISLVRERPAIYDPTDRSHRDRDAIAKLWREIADEMKYPGKRTVFIHLIINNIGLFPTA